jgi:predicted lysophospholipase L1 biosynthesis ABC-type transport system permease subunit
VIRNERTRGLQAAIEPVVYVPLAQFPRQNVHLIVRTRGEAPAAMAGIREAVRQADPHLPLGEVRTMEQVKEQSMRWAAQPTWALGAFASLAALMAALGLYGVLVHSVTQQRREIGIRMALGARPGDVVSHTLRSALSMLLAGMAAGLAGAVALTRTLESLLFQVSALDPWAVAAACGLMTLLGMLAAFLPASRAARVDPMTVLREEG